MVKLRRIVGVTRPNNEASEGVLREHSPKDRVQIPAAQAFNQQSPSLQEHNNLDQKLVSQPTQKGLEISEYRKKEVNQGSRVQREYHQIYK